jgi:hypothetical protein
VSQWHAISEGGYAQEYQSFLGPLAPPVLLSVWASIPLMNRFRYLFYFSTYSLRLVAQTRDL